MAHATVLTEHVGRGSAVCDLGSGAGIPGLAIAINDADARVALVDSMAKRCAFLEEAVGALDLSDRVSVRCTRAEDLARVQREHFDGVVARSFGPPPVTAEIAAGLIRIGGALIASSAPAGESRWNPEVLERLGFGPPEIVVREGRSFIVVGKTAACPERFPRRAGMPAKRPLW
jgi:16S rRNA (guanine527-N7)-methyltransferase